MPPTSITLSFPPSADKAADSGLETRRHLKSKTGVSMILQNFRNFHAFLLGKLVKNNLALQSEYAVF